MKELMEIQSALKVAKTHHNSYGNYNYRNAEDILEGVKPLLKDHECTLIVTDDLVCLGQAPDTRFYVKATVTLTTKDNISVSATGYAREDRERKKFDVSQLTGSASSYARKYALNGLFCLDDTKDADATNDTQPQLTLEQKQEYLQNCIVNINSADDIINLRSNEDFVNYLKSDDSIPQEFKSNIKQNLDNLKIKYGVK